MAAREPAILYCSLSPFGKATASVCDADCHCSSSMILGDDRSRVCMVWEAAEDHIGLREESLQLLASSINAGSLLGAES